MTATTRFNRTPGKTGKARRLRIAATGAERLLWSKLRARQIGGVSFRRQHPAGPYVLDFYCAALGIAVEVDGGHHGRREREAADRKRDDWLRLRGITVLRVSNFDVFRNISGVMEQIYMKIVAAAERQMTPTRSAARSDLPLSGGGDLAILPRSRSLRWKPETDAAASSPPPERGRMGGGQTMCRRTSL